MSSTADSNRSARIRLAGFYLCAVIAVVAGDVLVTKGLALLCSVWPWLAGHVWTVGLVVLIPLGLLLRWIYSHQHELKSPRRVSLAFGILICLQLLCTGTDDLVDRWSNRREEKADFPTRAHEVGAAGSHPPGPSEAPVCHSAISSAPTESLDRPPAPTKPAVAAIGKQRSEATRTFWIFSFATLVFGLASWRAHKLREAVTTYRSLATSDKNPRGLIVLLSPPTFVPELQFDPTTDVLTKIVVYVEEEKPGSASDRLKVDLLPTDQVDDAIAKLASHPDHNWEQLLRGIQRVRDTVDHVWVVGSPAKAGAATPQKAGERAKPDDGSWIYQKMAYWFLRSFLRPETQIHPDFSVCSVAGGSPKDGDEPVDFEDFEALFKRLRAVVEQANTLGLGHDEVAVDITGGIKMASVVGATLTLNDETLIQYVRTSGDQKARLYDLRVESPLGLD